MKSQNISVNSWPTMGVPQTDYPVTSHPTTMHQQHSLTCSKFKEEQTPIKSLLQQAYLRPSVKKERKMKNIPSWSIPSTTPAMPFEAMNFMNHMNVDKNLPAGAYYGEFAMLVKFFFHFYLRFFSASFRRSPSLHWSDNWRPDDLRIVTDRNNYGKRFNGCSKSGTIKSLH